MNILGGVKTYLISRGDTPERGDEIFYFVRGAFLWRAFWLRFVNNVLRTFQMSSGLFKCPPVSRILFLMSSGSWGPSGHSRCPQDFSNVLDFLVYYFSCPQDPKDPQDIRDVLRTFQMSSSSTYIISHVFNQNTMRSTRTLRMSWG